MSLQKKISAADLAKVLLGAVVASVAAHYLSTIIFLLTGGRPRFDDTQSLTINCSVVGFCLLVGWATRRLWLVGFILVGLGLLFLSPYLFAVRGTPIAWIRQFLLYIDLPLLAVWMFSLVSKLASIPERPKFVWRKQQTAGVVD